MVRWSLSSRHHLSQDGPAVPRLPWRSSFSQEKPFSSRSSRPLMHKIAKCLAEAWGAVLPRPCRTSFPFHCKARTPPPSFLKSKPKGELSLIHSLQHWQKEELHLSLLGPAWNEQEDLAGVPPECGWTGGRGWAWLLTLTPECVLHVHLDLSLHTCEMGT